MNQILIPFSPSLAKLGIFIGKMGIFKKKYFFIAREGKSGAKRVKGI